MLVRQGLQRPLSAGKGPTRFRQIMASLYDKYYQSQKRHERRSLAGGKAGNYGSCTAPLGDRGGVDSCHGSHPCALRRSPDDALRRIVLPEESIERVFMAVSL